MFTTSFWRDTIERATRAAATAFIPVLGGEAIFWNLGWEPLIGIPATAALLEIAASLAAIKIGKPGTPTMLNRDRTGM